MMPSTLRGVENGKTADPNGGCALPNSVSCVNPTKRGSVIMFEPHGPRKCLWSSFPIATPGISTPRTRLSTKLEFASASAATRPMVAPLIALRQPTKRTTLACFQRLCFPGAEHGELRGQKPPELWWKRRPYLWFE